MIQSAPPESLCLLRLSALGDVCNMVPVVRAFQHAWPNLSVTWIIGKPEHRLVADLPGVEFIVFDKTAGRAGIAMLRRRLAGRRFDVLVHAQVSLRANLLSMIVRARRRVGFDRLRSREGHGLVVGERIAAVPFQHQALAFLEFARHFGLPAEGIDRRPPIPDDAVEFAQRHQPDPHRAVLISPASSHRLRNWHARGYAEVADWIIATTGRPVILVGGPSDAERRLGCDIERQMRHRPLNLIGQDTLKQALAMLDRAACLITPDAGPAHFAAALGRPVIGLYAATWSRRSGPFGSLEHCVDRFPEAAREFAGKPPEALPWGKRLEYPGVMDLIDAGSVIERVEHLLSGGQTAAGAASQR